MCQQRNYIFFFANSHRQGVMCVMSILCLRCNPASVWSLFKHKLLDVISWTIFVRQWGRYSHNGIRLRKHTVEHVAWHAWPALYYHQTCFVAFTWAQFHDLTLEYYFHISWSMGAISQNHKYWLTEADWCIYASVNLVIIGSHIGLLPVRCRANFWTSTRIFSIRAIKQIQWNFITIE